MIQWGIFEVQVMYIGIRWLRWAQPTDKDIVMRVFLETGGKNTLLHCRYSDGARGLRWAYAPCPEFRDYTSYTLSQPLCTTSFLDPTEDVVHVGAYI